MKKLIRSIYDIIMDSEIEVRERIFIIITIISIPALICALIGDIIIGESPVEITALIATIIIAPVVTYYGMKKDRVQPAALFLAAGIVFVVVPLSFRFGGGASGGAIIWFCFAYMYIGLILVGIPRYVMMAILTVMVVFQYRQAYLNEAIDLGRSRSEWYVDSCISVILVGLAVYLMVVIEYRLYLDESKRAIRQAKEIEEMSRAQSVFFSSMSHEIRTPINTIIGLNEMNLRENVSEEVSENARNIQSASQILLSVINDILDMSKIESGKMDIIKAPYNVGSMITDIVNMISVRAKEKGLRFRVSVDPGLPSVLISDEVRLKQIMINLLNNAVKYTAKGEVSFQIHCTKKKEGFVAVTYTVEDTGAGIKKESIPYLFDAFRRVDEEKNRHIEGTGLGLSIVKLLTELLGGKISVSSVYTRGSTFNVEIEQEIVDEKILGNYDPMQLQETANTRTYHQSFEAPEAEILVVDDNSANLLVIRKLLRDTLVKIDTASSASECLEMTLKKRYNIIFMDHYMPQMSGIEALHAIREQAAGLCVNVPVVALTANAGGEYISMYRQEGFDDYLLKPLDAMLLEDTVLRLLPPDIVRITEDRQSGTVFESDSVIRQISKKVPVLITTDSASDLPDEILEKNDIPVIPINIEINDALFSDGSEIGSDTVIRHLSISGREIVPYAPHVDDYEKFFSGLLSGAQHIIHISTAKNIGRAYANACEAALDFYNVSVFDSGQISSGTGYLALMAKKMVDEGISDTEEIMRRLEEKKEKIGLGFVLDRPDYFARRFLSSEMCRLINMLKIHPVIGTRDSSIKIRGLLAGDREKAETAYIRRTLKKADKIDPSVLIITYVGLKRKEAERIRDGMLEKIPFERVYLKKASPGIAINCGPGTFGLIYAEK
ncbi:MAG: DegV family EDD domain-containing protein [Lachnospiraceae bacterium]|nr:DegV family EDD domain-containing protein [Lachnospiraceae bacterium]